MIKTGNTLIEYWSAVNEISVTYAPKGKVPPSVESRVIKDERHPIFKVLELESKYSDISADL